MTNQPNLDDILSRNKQAYEHVVNTMAAGDASLLPPVIIDHFGHDVIGLVNEVRRLREQMAQMGGSRDNNAAMLALLRDLVDADDCWFDHHGGCQAHGYLSLQPGEKCPHAEAKELLGSGSPEEDAS